MHARNTEFWNDDVHENLTATRERIHIWLELLVYSRQIAFCATLAEQEAALPIITAAITASHEVLVLLTGPWALETNGKFHTVEQHPTNCKIDTL